MKRKWIIWVAAAIFFSGTRLLSQDLSAHQDEHQIPPPQFNQPTRIAVAPLQTQNLSDSSSLFLRHHLYRQLKSLKMVDLAGDSIVEHPMYTLVDSVIIRGIWNDNHMTHGVHCAGADCSLEIGRLTEAEQVLLATFEQNSHGLLCNFKLAEVESGLILRQEILAYPGSLHSFIEKPLYKLVQNTSRVKVFTEEETEVKNYLAVNSELLAPAPPLKESSSKIWWWTGGGVLAAGATAVYFWLGSAVPGPEVITLREEVALE